MFRQRLWFQQYDTDVLPLSSGSSCIRHSQSLGEHDLRLVLKLQCICSTIVGSEYHFPNLILRVLSGEGYRNSLYQREDKPRNLVPHSVLRRS